MHGSPQMQQPSQISLLGSRAEEGWLGSNLQALARLEFLCRCWKILGPPGLPTSWPYQNLPYGATHSRLAMASAVMFSYAISLSTMKKNYSSTVSITTKWRWCNTNIKRTSISFWVSFKHWPLSTSAQAPTIVLMPSYMTNTLDTGLWPPPIFKTHQNLLVRFNVTLDVLIHFM